MSKEVFLLPSAKQILSYENGDFRLDEVATIFRFNFLNVYIWIEPSKTGYDVRYRGRFCDKSFIPTSLVVESFSDLISAISFFKRIVQDYIMLHDLYVSDSPDFDWKFNYVL